MTSSHPEAPKSLSTAVAGATELPATAASVPLPAVVPEAERAAHLAAVRQRRAGGFPAAAARAAVIEAGFPAHERVAHYQQLTRLSTVPEKIVWLRGGADRTLAAASGVSACARGCAHCCHLSVMISEREAQLIGREIGCAPREASTIAETAPIPPLTADPNGPAGQALARLQVALAARYTGVACTFLSATGECRIYAARPLACRRVINLDDDALLCRLVPGEVADQAYLDQRLEQAFEMQAIGPGVTLADLRDWFPSEGPAP